MSEQKNVIECLMRLSRSIRRFPSGEKHNSHGYYHLLRILAKNDGQSSRELAEIMDIRPSSLTEIMDKLEADGAIARIRDENDLRMIRVTLLDRGREIFEDFSKTRRAEQQGFVACLSEEEARIFCEICEKLSNEIESKSQCEDPSSQTQRHHHGRGCKDGHRGRRHE